MDYSKIPLLALFAVSMTACFAAGFARAYYSKCITSAPKDYNLLNSAISILAAIVLFTLGGFDTRISAYTFVTGIAFGVVTMLSAVLTSIAVNLGPLSYSYVIICSSTIVTALSGYLFWDEKLTILKVCGIILMFICCVLANQTDKETKKASLRWLIVCILNAVASAGVGLMQKTHQNSPHAHELNMFLVTAFIVSSIVSFVLYIVASAKKKNYAIEYKGNMEIKKLVYVILVIFAVTGIGVALNNALNLYLSGVVDSAIFFPIVNGGSVMFNIFASLLFFREKLSYKQWIGLIFGICAIACLCI